MSATPTRRPAAGQWSYETHELSEGYSSIVYDERGQKIADHLTEDRAALIAAAPDLLAALEQIADAHVPDQPASSGLNEADYVREHVARLRRIARAALRSARP